MEILALRERIEIGVRQGESHFREFKSAVDLRTGAPQARDPREIARDIGEALVAFANADGGELLVGVEDDGRFTGVPHNDRSVALLLDAPKSMVHGDTPLRAVIAEDLEGAGKRILYFSVDKSTEYVHLTSEGRCVQRRDRESSPVAAERIQFERREQISREYDRHFVDGATMADLDEHALAAAQDAMGLPFSPEKFLQYQGLAEYGMGSLRLRRAALLLFAKEIVKWHPRCAVRILRVRGSEIGTGSDYNITDDELTTENVLTLLRTAWEQLRPHLVETKFVEGALFREQAMYPEDACREALINALAHRDYSNEGASIEIQVFDGRMEVHSPGALLSTVTIEDLKKLVGVHQSRNAHLARVLREMGFMREVGEGIRPHLQPHADQRPCATSSGIKR